VNAGLRTKGTAKCAKSCAVNASSGSSYFDDSVACFQTLVLREREDILQELASGIRHGGS
jgi:hypothetical protein